MDNSSRREKVINGILDTSANEMENVGSDIIHMLIQDVKEWLIQKYTNYKSTSADNVEITLKELEERIEVSNKTIEIGMEKKEIAVIWAMKKLGYSEQETQEVIKLANEAYRSTKKDI